MVDTVKTVKSSGGDYSSLSGWEAGQQKVISSGDSEQAECYSFSDTTQLVIDGWTTASDAYIRIYTPTAERHDGKWNTSKYRLETTATNSSNENYVRFEGIQVSLNSATTYRYCINLVGASNNSDGCRVDACIVKRTGTGANQMGIRIVGGSVENYVRNSLAYDFSGTGSSAGFHAQMASNQSRLDNCTAHNCTLGFSTGYQDTIIRNCLAASCTNGYSATGDWYTGSDYNASTLASDAPGGNSRNSQTFTFVDEANDDFHLASSDAGALGYGQDLSGTFTVDVDGQTRSSWDIGYDEYVSSSVNLVLQDALHGHAADNIVLTQAHALVIADATHSHTADNLTLTQAHVLAIQDALHGHAADNLVLSISATLAIADALHVHTADNLTLTQAHVLAIADALHGHTAENMVLTQVHVLAIADALHAHSAENMVLTQAHVLAILDGLHGHTADNLTLTQQHVLAIADALHGHTADNVVLSTELLLTIADALHGHTAENPTLTQDHLLVIQDASHAHGADNLVLTQAHVLAIADALHAHGADNLSLTLNSVLVISDALHAHLADNLALSLEEIITPGERVFVIRAEGRIYYVAREARVLAILAESRTYTIH